VTHLPPRLLRREHWEADEWEGGRHSSWISRTSESPRGNCCIAPRTNHAMVRVVVKWPLVD